MEFEREKETRNGFPPQQQPRMIGGMQNMGMPPMQPPPNMHNPRMMGGPGDHSKKDDRHEHGGHAHMQQPMMQRRPGIGG